MGVLPGRGGGSLGCAARAALDSCRPRWRTVLLLLLLLLVGNCAWLQCMRRRLCFGACASLVPGWVAQRIAATVHLLQPMAAVAVARGKYLYIPPFPCDFTDLPYISSPCPLCLPGAHDI